MSENSATDLYRNDFVVFVPDYWDGKQALAVHAFLETLTMAIWNRYEKEMIATIAPPSSERQDASFPFLPRYDYEDSAPDLNDDHPELDEDDTIF